MYTVIDTRDIFYGDHPDFERKPVADIEGDETHWHTWSMRVYKHKTSGEHWSVEICQGKTEMQDDEDDEVDEVDDPPQRVELVEVPTTAKTVEVTLPTGPGPLADWLEANGHKVAAQAVRGFVLEWMPVEEPA